MNDNPAHKMPKNQEGVNVRYCFACERTFYGCNSVICPQCEGSLYGQSILRPLLREFLADKNRSRK